MFFLGVLLVPSLWLMSLPPCTIWSQIRVLQGSFKVMIAKTQKINSINTCHSNFCLHVEFIYCDHYSAILHFVLKMEVFFSVCLLCFSSISKQCYRPAGSGWSLDPQTGSGRIRIRRIPSHSHLINLNKLMLMGECLAYHKENVNQTNMYGNRLRSSPDVSSFYCQQASIASYHGSAMYVIVTCCRRSYCKEQWMVVIAEEDLANHGRTTSRNGQASHCWTLPMTGRWAVIAADAFVRVPQWCLGVTGIS